jgi:hypothetical protein
MKKTIEFPEKSIMRQFFILVVADEDRSRLSFPSAYDLAIYRLMNGRWGLNIRTKNRKVMTCGDEVLVYASGKRKNGMSFVGTARIASKPSPVNDKERFKLDSPSQTGATRCVESIGLELIEIFKCPVPIKSIYRNFDLVRNPDSPKWGCALMGGATRISEKDYKIVKESGKNLK